jgi:hypothetical protein
LAEQCLISEPLCPTAAVPYCGHVRRVSIHYAICRHSSIVTILSKCSQLSISKHVRPVCLPQLHTLAFEAEYDGMYEADLTPADVVTEGNFPSLKCCIPYAGETAKGQRRVEAPDLPNQAPPALVTANWPAHKLSLLIDYFLLLESLVLPVMNAVLLERSGLQGARLWEVGLVRLEEGDPTVDNVGVSISWMDRAVGLPETSA